MIDNNDNEVTEENERATEALKAFKQQYPGATSGDLQTFMLGWRSCEELRSLDSLDALENEFGRFDSLP